MIANPDDKGQAELVADTNGEAVKVRIDGQYLAEALQACGGMVDFKLSSPTAPMLFSVDGYQLVVMPMMIELEAKAVAKQADQVAEALGEQADQEAEAKPKPKRKRKDREAVAVA